MLPILGDVVSAALATALFSLLICVPRRNIFATSILAAVGYLIFDVVLLLTERETSSYFLSTLIIALVAELFARLLKSPSTVFIYPAIIPFVPGLGIYRTMLSLVTHDYAAFAEYGTATLLATVSMVMALAVSAFIVKVFTRRPKRKRKIH